MKQRGGIKIKPPYNAEDAFRYFMDNLKLVTLITCKTKGGILFKLDLEESVESPYLITRSNYLNSPVYSILVKICYIDDEVINEEDVNEEVVNEGVVNGYTNPELEIKLNKCNSEEFYNEIFIQCNIFKESLDRYLEPICPSIVYSKLYDNKIESRDLIRLLFVNVRDDNLQLKLIIKSMHKCFVDESLFKLGLIVMEYMDGFVPLSSIKPKNDFYDRLAIFELWRLYNLPQRYLHGDPHKDNFMVNPDYDYINGIKGRVIIIDFGATFSIECPNVIAHNSIASIILLSLNNPSPNWAENFNMRRFSAYKWLHNMETTNTISLSDIYERREQAKQEFVERNNPESADIERIYNPSFRGGNFKYKYLKYKNKYLKLKKTNL